MATEDNTTEEHKLLTKLNNYFQASLEHPSTTDWLKNVQEDFEYFEGKQWTSAEEKELKDRGQPVIHENEIKHTVDTLVGHFKRQKNRIGFRGRNLEQDEPTANTLSDLILHVQQRCNYEFEEEEAFRDGIIGGVGWLEPFVEFDDAYQPEIKIRNVNCLDVYPDPYARKYDLSDAKYVCIAKWVHIDEAKEMYPDKKLDLNYLYEGSEGTLSGIDGLKNENYVDHRLNRIRLVEVRYKEKKKKKLLIYSDPEKGNITEDITDSVLERQLVKEYPGAKVVTKLSDNIKVGVFCGNILLDEVKDLPHDYKNFYLIPYYVYRKKNGEPYGEVRELKDPQAEINKRRSKALHLLNVNQAIAREGAVRDEDELRDQLAQPDGVMFVRGDIDKDIKIEKNVEVAQGQMQLLAESKDAMQRISGVPRDPGDSQQLRSGSAMARKEASINVGISPKFENFRKTRLMVGKHVYELIKQYFTEEQVFYITDDMNQSKQFAFTQQDMNNIKEGIYDVIVTEMPDTVTVQDEQFTMMVEFLKGMNLPPQIGMSLFPLMINLSQFRNKKEIVDAFKQMQQPSPILPKVSLQLQWDALYPEEKASFAQMMGQEELAQQVMQGQRETTSQLKAKEEITKTQMKVQGEGQKQPDPRMEMAMKAQEHQQKMVQSEQTHGQKMKQTSQSGNLKLIQQIQQAKQKENESKSNSAR